MEQSQSLPRHAPSASGNLPKTAVHKSSHPSCPAPSSPSPPSPPSSTSSTSRINRTDLDITMKIVGLLILFCVTVLITAKAVYAPVVNTIIHQYHFYHHRDHHIGYHGHCDHPSATTVTETVPYVTTVTETVSSVTTVTLTIRETVPAVTDKTTPTTSGAVPSPSTTEGSANGYSVYILAKGIRWSWWGC
ncbi:hypothetical protein BGX38DRAFT_379295 [Terfezia claveryi]|nr:hypothetical protein BGX38DRAFT_379295 [Terfezia claveryi]